MKAIDLAPQWTGEPSSSSRPAAANSAHVQPLPSIPMNVVPFTVPSGALKSKLRLAKMKPSTPRASEATPISATGPLASDTPRRGGIPSSYVSTAVIRGVPPISGCSRDSRQSAPPCARAAYAARMRTLALALAVLAAAPATASAAPVRRAAVTGR